VPELGAALTLGCPPPEDAFAGGICDPQLMAAVTETDGEAFDGAV
jgi:hypothetical protein